jgi:hypothetical protein
MADDALTASQAIYRAIKNGHNVWLPIKKANSYGWGAVRTERCVTCGAGIAIYRGHCLRYSSPALDGPCRGPHPQRVRHFV